MRERNCAPSETAAAMTRIRDRVPPNDFQRLIAAISRVAEPEIERVVETIGRAVKPKPTTRRKPARKIL
jgi:hypothetical protein